MSTDGQKPWETKLWAAIDSKGNIIAVGAMLASMRFDRRCLNLSFGDYGYWVKEGARYCEIFDRDKIKYRKSVTSAPSGVVAFGQNIKNLRHGRVRRCRSIPKGLFL